MKRHPRTIPHQSQNLLTWTAGSHQWPCARLCACTRAVQGSVGRCYACGRVPGSCQLGSFPQSHRWPSAGSQPPPRHPAGGTQWWLAGPVWSRSTSGWSSPHSMLGTEELGNSWPGINAIFNVQWNKKWLPPPEWSSWKRYYILSTGIKTMRTDEQWTNQTFIVFWDAQIHLSSGLVTFKTILKSDPDAERLS